MSLTKTNKIILAFVGMAVALALVAVAATPTQAQTAEELQALIAQLQAQIAALTGSTDSGAGSAGCAFTRSLTIGSSGADVNCLQNYLTSTGHFNFSGGSTGYFGPITQSAVAAWQGANGVAPAVGYFGPISMARYAALTAGGTPPSSGLPAGCTSTSGFSPITGESCAGAGLPAGCNSTSGFSPTTGQKCDSTGGTPSGPVVSDGVLITSTLSLESTPADGTDVKEGERNVDVAKWKVKTSGSDGTMIQFGVRFTERPWLYFDAMRIVDGSGNVISERTGMTSADFTEVTAGSDYRLTFGNLAHNLPKDVDNFVILQVSAFANNDKANKTITIDQVSNSVVIRDSNDLNYTVSDGVGDDRTVDFDTNADTGRVIPSLNSASSKSQWVKVSNSGTTDNVELMKFNLKAENDDVRIEQLRIAINVGTAATSTMIKSAGVYDGSTLLGDINLTTGVVPNLTLDIPKDTIKTLSVKAKIADSDDFTLGMGASTTLEARAGSTEGIQGIDSKFDALTVSGSDVISNDTYFTTTVANLSNLSATVTPVPDKPAQATVQFKFSMTADGGDIFISKTVATALGTSTTHGDVGIGTSTITAVTASDTHPSDTSAHWVVSPGTTRTFTYTGSMDNTSVGNCCTAGVKNFKITTVYWDDDSSGLQEFKTTFGLEDLEINHFLST